MSNISRSEYQKVSEENKRLRKDLMSIARLDPNATEIINRWRGEVVKENDKTDMISEAVLEFYDRYKDQIPEGLRLKERHMYETVVCECGHLCPVEYAIPDEDGGAWICANCFQDALSANSLTFRTLVHTNDDTFAWPIQNEHGYAWGSSELPMVMTEKANITGLKKIYKGIDFSGVELKEILVVVQNLKEQP